MIETIRKNVKAKAQKNVKLLDANSSRNGSIIYNNTNKTMYIILGIGEGSAEDYTLQLYSGSVWELPRNFYDFVSARCPPGTSGFIMVTEW